MSSKRKYRNKPPVVQTLLQAKSNRAKQMIARFMKRQRELHDEHSKVVQELDLPALPSPEALSTIAYIAPDATLVIQYDEWRGAPRFNSVILAQTLDKTPKQTIVVPTPDGDAPILFGFAAGATATLVNCGLQLNDRRWHIKYAFLSLCREDDPRLRDPERAALTDLRLTCLALLLRPADNAPAVIDKQALLEKLGQLIAQFRTLLAEANREEEVQSFLKQNPILLGPCTLVIPKHKLADDFVTDYVLQKKTETGYHYVLVEIERPDRRLFKADNDLHGDLTHAQKQTLDWDVWLQTNQAFLRNKLPGFETPEYRIIIGRSADLNDAQKALLRALNRSLRNVQILSFDDLLAEATDLAASLQRLITPLT